MHSSRMPPFLLACLLFLLYGPFFAAAVPAMFDKREPKDCMTECAASTKLLTKTTISATHPASSLTVLLGKDLCTRATVTVTATETSVSTKTHTVTERVVGPTRLGADKRGVGLDCTLYTKPHSTSSTSSTQHKTTAPGLVITRRASTTTTSIGLAHSIHFAERSESVLPGHAKPEDAPTHGQKRS